MLCNFEDLCLQFWKILGLYFLAYSLFISVLSTLSFWNSCLVMPNFIWDLCFWKTGWLRTAHPQFFCVLEIADLEGPCPCILWHETCLCSSPWFLRDSPWLLFTCLFKTSGPLPSHWDIPNQWTLIYSNILFKITSQIFQVTLFSMLNICKVNVLTHLSILLFHNFHLFISLCCIVSNLFKSIH